jgi:hypothetical protein
VKLGLAALIPLALAGLGWVASAGAAPSGGAFGARDVVSTIGVARVADEAGDGALLARLNDGKPRAEALVAVRAAPFAQAPERLVPALAQLACGRDPALAPEASAALLAIADGLDPHEFEAREVLMQDLRQAEAALACGEQAPAPRADILFALRTTTAAFAQLAASTSPQ